jgi:aldehyde:ferredoxin oxidoreductase
MKKARDDYDAFMGWDDDGVPAADVLKKYDLDFAIADMN